MTLFIRHSIPNRPLTAYSIIFMIMMVARTQAQPYSGTIFIDPDIINASDPSLLTSVTYTGQGMETVYDYRVGWTTINAYLFDVVWSDGLSCVAMVNPEFGSVAAAQVEAEIYGAACGKVHTCLRIGVHALWIHAGVYSFGGGSNAITIHTGRGQEYIADGILEEAFVHECTHCTLSPIHDQAAGWIAAQQADPGFISTYAQDYPTTEDLPESYLPWLAVRYRASRISVANYNTILATMPNRLAYLDSLECDLFPIVTESGIRDATRDPLSFRVFPSPASSWINVRPSHALSNNTRLELLATDGRVVRSIPLSDGTGIDVSDVTPGLYIWRCLEAGIPQGKGTIAIE